MLTAQGFGGNHPPLNLSTNSFTNALYPVSNAPRTSNIFGVPFPSIQNKFINPMFNGSIRGYVKSLPYQAGWEQNFAQGMPIWTNSKRSNTDSVVCASPAVINYLLEEAARMIFVASTTNSRKTQERYLSEFKMKEHLYATSVEEFAQKWHFYGNIHSVMGKKNESGLGLSSGPVNEVVFNCNVSQSAHILNYWGNTISDGDRLYWELTMKQNTYSNFYDPSGAIIGTSRESPERFFQLRPVSFGRRSYSVSHNRNYLNLDEPLFDDLDFVNHNQEIDQYDVEINYRTGEMIPKQLDITKEVIKKTSITCDLYSYGLLIPAGVVNKGPRGKANPSQMDLNLALRDDYKAQTLESIEVFVHV